MKNFFNKGAFIFGVLWIIATGTFAQESKQMEGVSRKMLVDTTLIKAQEITLEPGQKSNVHTHPAHFFYALTPCHLKVSYTDGKSEEYHLNTGENGFSDPERPHATENIGKESATFLLVELKEHPFKMAAKSTSK